MFLPALGCAAPSPSRLLNFCLTNVPRCRANIVSSNASPFFPRRGYTTGRTPLCLTSASQPFKRLQSDSCCPIKNLRDGTRRRYASEAERSSSARSHVERRQQMYKHRNRTLMMYSTAALLFMGGMSYAAVPLYRAFCAATGFAGTPVVGTGKFSPERLVPAPEAGRIRVRFNADTSEALPWQFVPQQKFVDVLPGETSLAFYKAKNKAPYDVIGIATYNVTPDRIAPYFAKVECFCFEEQKLLAEEEVDMPLLFFIDRDVLDDPSCRNVDDIVLSYTFFRARRNEHGQLEPDAPEDVVQASMGFDKYEHAPKPEDRQKEE